MLNKQMRVGLQVAVSLLILGLGLTLALDAQVPRLRSSSIYGYAKQTLTATSEVITVGVPASGRSVDIVSLFVQTGEACKVELERNGTVPGGGSTAGVFRALDDRARSTPTTTVHHTSDSSGGVLVSVFSTIAGVPTPIDSFMSLIGTGKNLTVRVTCTNPVTINAGVYIAEF